MTLLANCVPHSRAHSKILRKAIPLVLVFGVAAASSCFANTWVYRPGLWKLTETSDGLRVYNFRPDIPEDIRAKIRAMNLPRVSTDQFCVSGTANPLSPFLNVPKQPPGICEEVILAKDAEGQNIQNDCLFPSLTFPGPHSLVAPTEHVTPSFSATANRHIRSKSPAKGMIDSVDAVSEVAGTKVKQSWQLRWSGAARGNARMFHDLF